MAELKTKQTKESVTKFISKISDAKKQEDAKKLLTIFKDATKATPKLWGTSVIGFGKYHYKSKRSTQEGDWFIAGFSPRKSAFSLYIMAGFKEYQDLLEKLGKHKVSSGCCLYIKKVEEIDTKVLKTIIEKSTKEIKKKFNQS